MPKPYFENKKQKIKEIIMVDHAGEFGAQKIYEGQIRYTKNPKDKQLISHMLEQELEHLDYFQNQIKEGKSKPTALMPLWSILGYSLGAISAKAGPKTAMMLTESVEEVIVEHYDEQITYLKETDPKNPLLKKIQKFKADEAEHIHIAIDNDSKNAKFHKLLSNVTKIFCKSAIFLSKKM